MKHKETLLVAVVGAVLLINFAYLGRAMMDTGAWTSGGYIIASDQKISETDYMSLRPRNFSTSIILKSDACTGIVTSCSFAYKSGVDASADITGPYGVPDGRIDEYDLKLVAKGYGCDISQACWNNTVSDCFFIVNDREYSDPTGDCYVNQSDLNMISANFEKSVSTSCTSGNDCASDVNHDGIVDVKDLSLMSKLYGQYADDYPILGHVSDGDLNKDGKIDVRDVSIVAKNIGEQAIESTCTNTALINNGGGEYIAKVDNVIALYYVGIAYKCA